MEEYCKNIKCPFRFKAKAGKTDYCECYCDAYLFRKWLYEHGYQIVRAEQNTKEG